MRFLEKLVLQNKSAVAEKPLQADVIALQKEFVRHGLPFLPSEFICFLKKFNGVKGIDSSILGIPPLQNKMLDIWDVNQKIQLAKNQIIIGYDDFCFLLYDGNAEQYTLVTRDLSATLETFEKDEWEDALLSIIHFDNV